MAQNELVTDVIAESAYKQISRLRTDMKDATAELVAFSKAGKDAFSGITASQSLIDLVNGVKAAADANKGAILAQQQYNTTLEKASAIMASYGKEAKEYTDVLKRLEAVEKLAAEAAVKTAEARKKNAKAALDEAKASNENSKAKLIEQKYTEALTKEKERLDKADAKEQENLRKKQSAYAQLNQEYKVAAQLAQDLGAKQFMLQREVAAGNNVQVNNTELARLGPLLAEAQANALKLSTALLEVEKAVGKSQRNVGNYNSAQFAMSQLLREAPSFAYSFSTGILALSNNIPILVDEIEKLNIKNKEMVAAGEKPTSVLKTLGGAIFSVNGIITLGVAALTIFAGRLSMSGDEMSEAEKKAKKLKDTIADLNTTMKETYVTELSKSNDLFDTAQNIALSYTARTKAIDELLRLYPELLANLDKEAILNGKVATQQDIISSVISKRASVKYFDDLADALRKSRAELEKTLEESKKAGGIYNPFSSAGTDEDLKKQQAEIDKLNAKIADAQYNARLFNQEAQYLLNPKDNHQGRILADIDLEIKKQEEIRDTNTAEAKSHKDAIARLKELELERKKYLGDEDKKKTPKDERLKNENDLTKELYSEYAKRLLLEAEYQKAIYIDETKTLEERLMAYRQYSELVFQAQTEALSAQYDNLDNSLKEIERIEAKSADKRTQQEKDLLGKKALLLQQYNNISAEYDLKEKQHIEATAKGIVDLQQNEVSKRLSAIKDLVTNVDIQEGIALKNLSDKFQAGEIKYKTYTDSRKKIEDQFQKDKYQQIIDYLAAEIAALAAAGVNTTALQDELNKAQAALYAADLKAFEDTEKKKVELKNTLNGKIWEAVDTGIASAKSMLDGYYQRQLDHEQALLDAIEERKNAEIDAVNGQMLSADEKAKKIAAINAQAFAQEKAIQNEMKRIKREQAIADRVAAILGVVEGVAKAEAANLINFANPALIGYATGIAALIAGIGAAQVATILATPLPVYGDGTGDKLHPGGGAILGDKYERELIEEPGKAPYWSEAKPTYYDLAAGTKVTPERLIPEHELIAAQMGFMTPGLISGLIVNNSDYKALEKTMRDELGSVRDAINNKPVPSWITTNGEMRKIVTRGNSTTEYINSNFHA